MKKLYTVVLLLAIVIAKHTHAQTITTYAGGGSIVPGDGGPATAVLLGGTFNTTFDQQGNLYIACWCSVRKVSPTGIITTVAGKITSGGYSGDGGPATNALLSGPSDVAFDTAENMYIADLYNNVIRKVDMHTNIITTYAGGGTSGLGDGGLATAAEINGLKWICTDNFGNLYLSDNINNRIRKVNPAGIMTTIAGNGAAGFSSDGGLADTTMINRPLGITTDSAGNVFFADAANSRVRSVNIKTGVISTVAGGGTATFTEGAAATAITLVVDGLRFDGAGNLYADLGYNYDAIVIKPTGYAYTIAGSGAIGYSGDGGPATAAKMGNTGGISVDGCGSVYVTDNGNAVIRKVTYPLLYTVPYISLASSGTAKAGTTVTVTATVAGAGPSYVIHWLNRGVQFATTTVLYVTYTKSVITDTITAEVVPSATYGCYESAMSPAAIYITTGVTTVASASPIVLYPNPTSEKLIVHTGNKQRYFINIYDMMGNEKKKEIADSQELQIDVRDLPAGVYNVQVDCENGARINNRILIVH